MKGLYLLFTIIRRADTAEYENFYRGRDVSVIYTTQCNGTAHEKTLSLLGIEKNAKSLLISLMTGETLKDVVKGLTLDMKIDLPDRGIAVAVPLSGI